MILVKNIRIFYSFSILLCTDENRIYLLYANIKLWLLTMLYFFLTYYATSNKILSYSPTIKGISIILLLKMNGEQ